MFVTVLFVFITGNVFGSYVIFVFITNTDIVLVCALCCTAYILLYCRFIEIAKSMY